MEEQNNANPPKGSKPHSQKRKAFHIVLYLEDQGHMKILEWLLRHTMMYRVCYILHNQDVYEEDEDLVRAQQRWDNLPDEYKEKNPKPMAGGLKKPHYHVLVICHEAITEGNMKKLLGLKHLEIPYSIESQIMYFLHDTPASFHKHPYLASELRGDKELCAIGFGKNLHFVQLSEIADIASSGETYTDFIASLAKPEFEKYQETFIKDGYCIKGMFDERQKAIISGMSVENQIKQSVGLNNALNEITKALYTSKEWILR